jgi:hypothetical protein
MLSPDDDPIALVIAKSQTGATQTTGWLTI